MPADTRTWRDISRDPNAPEVQAYLRKALREAYQGRIKDTNAFLIDFVRDQTVLDIGIVAHTIEQATDPRWRHNRIRAAAVSVLGVDILEEPLSQLRERGYNVRAVDATSDTDLGQRFARVVLGDVIEHVDSPVALLRFAKRHLEPDGLILCSTPNPFLLGTILQGLRDGTFIANAEHICWITPSMALELGQRAGLRLAAYWHAHKTGGSLLRRFATRSKGLIGWLDTELSARTFVYLFRSH